MKKLFLPLLLCNVLMAADLHQPLLRNTFGTEMMTFNAEESDEAARPFDVVIPVIVHENKVVLAPSKVKQFLCAVDNLPGDIAHKIKLDKAWKWLNKWKVARGVVATAAMLTGTDLAANLLGLRINTFFFAVSASRVVANQTRSINPLFVAPVTLALGLDPFNTIDEASPWLFGTGLSTVLPITSVEHLSGKAERAAGEKDVFQYLASWSNDIDNAPAYLDKSLSEEEQLQVLEAALENVQ